MEASRSKESTPSRKGGRPKIPVKCNQKLTVMCTRIDRILIKAKAREAQLTISEYLRKLGVNSSIDRREKVLPKEVLAFTATLNHLAANLNQIAKKRNGPDELNALERVELQHLSGQCQQLAVDLKNYLR